jgi:tRNA-splicing ligase RtcB
MTAPWTQIFRKIDDYRWEIPASYKPGMRVPGLVFADEPMLRQIAEEQALEQVANVATLPGIVGHSLAMPDIHWGYGFPVGGVAAFRVEDGIISPGGVGYDLNCLDGEVRILHEFGYSLQIEEFGQRWNAERVKCVNPHTEVKNTEILAYLKQFRPATQVFKVITVSGRQIVATGDHPFLTLEGMVPLKDLGLGQLVSVYPFEGVPYEPPSNQILVTEEDLHKAYSGNPRGHGLTQITKVLKARHLLPLRMNDAKLPYLIKLMGFVQGDGSLHFHKNGGSQLGLYGNPVDLNDLRRDIQALGFIPSRIYRRSRSHAIKTSYGVVKFARIESFVHCGSTALALLLQSLGTTVGNKAQQDFGTPVWLDPGPRWMKRLYLAALFGAELATPKTVTGHPYNFYAPILSLNKRRANSENGRRYLEKIRAWLAEFGVESSLIHERDDYVTQDGDLSIRLRLQISSRPENLIRLWSLIGFEYNRRKQYLGSVAVHYLRLKCLALEERKASVETARGLSKMGFRLKEITAVVGSPYVDESFIARSLKVPPRSGVRICSTFPDFGSFLKERTRGLGKTGQVWDAILHKEAIPFQRSVYDFTVLDVHHNFIANSFIVSNCGVRLIRTDLNEDQVREKLEPLVQTLFRDVPSGVGSLGRLKVDMREVDSVLRGGARWAVEHGYGWPEDLEVIEAGGALPQSNPDAVGQEAKQRGRGQIGTLGSGNHFLEVQVLDEIYDPIAARAMGIETPGTIVILIHSGSRGLGHQVCTDYLRTAERAQKRYGIEVVDRQLACMPFASPEGQQYFGAMCAAANFAWANRQLIMHWAREGFSKVFGDTPQGLGMSLVYDVAHNIAKIEEYTIEGKHQKVIVHRKGATRAFPPGHPEVPARYQAVGQPVLVPGDMGRYSFIAAGAEVAMRESFGSSCHGAGRRMGRKAATRALAGVDVAEVLRQRGILVRAQDRRLLAEEAPEAYKDVADVVAVCEHAGISRRIARTKPIGVVKG